MIDEEFDEKLIEAISDIQGAYPGLTQRFYQFADENKLKEALRSLVKFLHKNNLTNSKPEDIASTVNQTEENKPKTRFEHALQIFERFFIALTKNEENFTENTKNEYSFFQLPAPGVMNTCLLFAQIAYISEALINDFPFNSGSFNFAYNRIVRTLDSSYGLTQIATPEWCEWQHRILFILGIYYHINPYIENLSAILKSSIINRDRERIDKLVKAGVLLSSEDTKFVDFSGYTLVHIAAHFNFPVIPMLLTYSDKVINAKSYEDKSTALHLAASRNSKESVEILLRYPKIEVSPIDRKGHTPLYYAAKKGNSDIVNLVMKHKPKLSTQDAHEIDEDGQSLLHFAAQHGYVSLAKILVQHMLKESVESLLTYPKIEVSPVDIKGHTPLYYAAINGNSDIVNLLMEQKPKLTTQEAHEINKDGQSLLHFAAHHGYASLAKILVRDMLVDPNVRTINKFETPLNLAVRGGHLATVEVLLTYSATIDLEIEDIYMKTPYDYALEAAIQSKNYTIVDRFNEHHNISQSTSNRTVKLPSILS